MLTYQLQPRIIHVTNGKKITLPNDVSIEITLEPAGQFGGSQETGKAMAAGSDVQFNWNANTGRQWVTSKTPFDPIEVTVNYRDQLKIEFRGNKYTTSFRCDTLDHLLNRLTQLHYYVPLLLNLNLSQPAFVVKTEGRIGDAEFYWGLMKSQSVFAAINQQSQEKRVGEALSDLGLISNLKNHRLTAALYYFYVANRLDEAGNSPYEFLAEVVLNLHKVLETLFGPNRDHVRQELKSLGYSSAQVEFSFIPIMILRNEFNVGHVMLSMLDFTQRKELYEYLELRLHDFRKLLQTIAKKVDEGDYKLTEVTGMVLSKEKQKIMDDLVATFRKKI